MLSTTVASAFENAKTTTDYRRAKRLAGKLDATTQLALVDTIITAWRRVGKAVA